jgi:hypothetical protein
MRNFEEQKRKCPGFEGDMLTKVSKYSKSVRWLLPVLLLFPFVAKDVHLLLVAHDEHETCVHKGAERHFHQGDGALEACFICDFTFSSFEVPEDIVSLDEPAVFSEVPLKPDIHAFHPVFLLTYTLRGPPAG